MFIWQKGDLNEEQEKAILEEDSLILVACPGSGKTRTLTYKIAYELSKLESEKEYIVAITYTNSAADEIKERVEILGVDTNQLWIGTIHAFCLEWILKPYSLYLTELKDGFKIINSFDSEEILTDLCIPYRNSNITYWDMGYIATPNGYQITSLDPQKIRELEKILKDYHKILLNNHQIDFEQILYYSYRILKEKPVINLILAKIFPFILIDEYQDTKEIQYHIIASILQANNGNSKTLIVGDPNQSIYDTLGGFPMKKIELETLLSFKLNDSHSLASNYRSSARIINYFDFFKTYNTKIVPAGKDKEYESIITFNSVVNQNELEDEIVRLLKENINQKNISPNEICIAAPQWIPLAGLTRSLMIKLPDYSFDGPGMAPFSRDIDNFWYKLSRIVLTEPSPNLYIRRLRWSKEVLEELSDIGVEISNLSNKSFLKFCNSVTIEELDGLKYLSAFFEKVCLFLKINIEVFPMLKEHYDSFFNSSKARIERLEKDGISSIGDIENFKKVFKQREGIKISTIHGVKGTEFDTVIGFGLLEGWVPHFNDNNGVENSKKMLYVLSSRARKNLHLISETGRNVHHFHAPKGRLPTSHLVNHNFDYDS